MKNAQQASLAKSILCVDDDTDTCELMKFLFHEYRLTAAHRLAEASHLIEETRFDLYIFDNWMPDGSGIELCQKVRALGIEKPIIFVSAAAQKKEINEAMSSGASRYLTKPCEPDELKQIVKELLD